MANKTFTNIRIKQKIDTSSNWDSKNPVIKKGEIAVETDSSYTDDQSVFNTGVNLHVGKTDNSHLNTNDETAEIKKAIADRFYECSSEEYANLPASKLVDGKVYYIPDKYDTDSARVIYGFHIDPNESDPYEAVTYIAEAVGMVPVSMSGNKFSYGSWANAFFMPKPCMVKYDGTLDYYLDPDDYTKKVDGTASDVANANYGGNAMMEWPLIWYKFDTFGCEEGEVNFFVSNEMVDSDYRCWCNYDADGNIIPHFYTAIYNGTGTEKLRSISGVPFMYPITYNEAVERAMKNNTTNRTEWYIDVFADIQLINMLLVLLGKTLKIGDKFGSGMNTDSYSEYTTGSLNDKGLFYKASHAPFKVFGMENYWMFYPSRWFAGMTNHQNKIAIKLTHGTNDGSTAFDFNENGNGYIDTDAVIDTSKVSQGYISRMLYNNNFYVPNEYDGTSSHYYCAEVQATIMDTNENTQVCRGPGFFLTLRSPSVSSLYESAALSLKPLLNKSKTI